MRLRATSLKRSAVPVAKALEQRMLSAVRAAGGAAWYMPDDFLTLGPELVSGAWTTTTGITVSGEATSAVITFNNAATGVSSYNVGASSAMRAGAAYQVTYTISGFVSGTFQFQSGGGGYGTTVRTSNGTFTDVFSPTAIATLFAKAQTAGSTFVVSNISLREILSAKDFQDAAGTLPTYLGGTVGLLTDRSYGGSIGPELIPSYDMSSASWSDIGTTSSVTSNGFTNASGTTAGRIIGAATIGMVQGKTYVVSVPYSKNESASTFSIRIAAGVDIASSTASSGTLYGIATAGSTGLQLRYTNNGTITFGAISIRELSGVHTTQATAGNRPLVSRIPRKLGPELVTNGGFNSDASGWTQTHPATVACVSGELEITANGSSAYPGATQVITTSVGKIYQVSVKSRRGTSASSTGLTISRYAGSGNLLAVAINAATTMRVYTALITSDWALWNVLPHASGNPATVGTVYFDDISVREVLEWSYALTFDGTNDSLAAPASVIGANLSQPYTMISWGKVGQISGITRCILGDSARLLGVSNLGKVTLGHAGVAFFDSSYTAQIGEQLVMEATYNGTNLLNVFVNGVNVYSASAVNPPTTPASGTSIGQRGNATSYWAAEIGGVIVCPAVMTDAQRAAVRKFAAAQGGLVL